MAAMWSIFLLLSIALAPSRLWSQLAQPLSATIGPEDQLSIHAVEVDELTGKTFAVDERGMVSLPLVGRLQAAGMTVEELEANLTKRLGEFVNDPQIAVSVSELRSRPVSLVGALVHPGIQQLRGSGSLLEMITAAGGPRPEAGSQARVLRRLNHGPIPLRSAAVDPDGEHYVAVVNLRALLGSETVEENIPLKPHDVVIIPEAPSVYVMGEVARQGNYAVRDKETLTVLEALSLAGGLTRSAKPQESRILRSILGGPKRAELEVDLKSILAGRTVDLPLMPGDVLFVPDSTGKRMVARAVEAALTAGTQMMTWGVVVGR